MTINLNNRTINRYGSTPMYRQLASRIREAIASGELQPGEKLPAEGTICELTGASRTAVREAMSVLKNEGLIITRNGRASRIASPVPVRRMDASRYVEEYKILRNADRNGTEHPQTSRFAADHNVPLSDVMVDVEIERERATAADCARLAIPPKTLVLRRRMLKYAAGVPVEIQRSVVPYLLARGTVLEDPTVQPFPGGTQAELWSAGCRNITRIPNEVKARMPSEHEHQQLQLDAVVPVLDIVRVFWEDDKPVEASRVIVPANRVVLAYETILNVAE